MWQIYLNPRERAALQRIRIAKAIADYVTWTAVEGSGPMEWLERLRIAMAGTGNTYPNDTTIVRRGDLREALAIIDETLKRRAVNDMAQGAERDTLTDLKQRGRT